MTEIEFRFPWFVALVVGLTGASVGSFLNVVIYRLPRGESLVRPRSRCPGCGQPLAWYDNVPIISWLVLRGRCRRCRVPISPRYLLVELCGAVLALAAWRRFGLSVDGLAVFVFFALLIAITFIDLEHWLILHSLTWPGIAAGLLQSLVSERITFADSALGAAGGFLVFAAVGFLGEKVLKKEALGGGDKWLLALIGAFAGWRALLPVVLISSFTGAVVGITLLVFRRGAPPPAPPALPSRPGEEPEEPWQPPAHAVPFGPFLSLAAMVVVLFEDALRGAMILP